MRNALIVPSETGCATVEIKRALLSFDNVALVSPEDRDIYPESVGFSAFAPFPMSVGHQPNRPLGKVPDHDAVFDRMLSECRAAHDAGCLEILSTYDKSQIPEGFSIGAIPLGGFPLDPSALWARYRCLAQDQSYLKAALDSQLVKLVQEDESRALSASGIADTRVNDGPELPMLLGPIKDEALREPLTVACRSRLASTIKILGFAQMRELVPIFFEQGGDRITGRLVSESSAALDDVESDPFWVRRRIAMEVAIEEFVDEEALDALPIERVLEMRASGSDYGKEVERFHDTLSELTSDPSVTPENLRRLIQDRLRDFRAKVEDYEVSRREIGWKVANRALAGGTTTLTAGAGLNFASSALSITFAPLAWLSLIPLAVLWGLRLERDIGPDLREILRQSKKQNRLPEMAIYKRLGAARSR